MTRTVAAALSLAAALCASPVLAQTGGSLTGYIKDEQGAVLPGVTVTATSPELIRPTSALTDAAGYYRLLNLPPGEYAISAELTGFATTKRENILLRANANFAVDLTLKVGALQESVTVAGESPMLEISRPSNVLNVDGDFQKQMPIAARRNWSDFLEMTPGVHSRPFDDGSGRMVYFGHSTEHFAHVVQLEGMQAGNYNDFQLTYVQMGSDMIQDTQVKTGGVDASTPMGTGLAINVITKSGGNTFRGTAGFAYQPLDWNDDNTGATTRFDLPSEVQAARAAAGLGDAAFVESKGGTPAQNGLKQVEGSIGGPIKKDKIWFFGSIRYSKVEVPIPRTQPVVNAIKAFKPDAVLFNNLIEGYQPYVKVTGRLGTAHELAAVYQRDLTNGENNWEYYSDPLGVYSNGGNLYTVKLNSVWGGSVSTSLLAGYNDKGSNSIGTYSWSRFQGTGPSVEVYSGTSLSAGLIRGNNLVVQGGNRDNEFLGPCSLITLRGDLTYFKQGWTGSHEFQTGFFIEPRNVYDVVDRYVNDGFYLERRTWIDSNNPAAGTVPFYRQYVDPVELQTRKARDSDYAVYLQDSWKPTQRLTANIGLRADWVKRVDDVFKVTRENSWTIQPRVGFSYLLTKDSKNILRGSYVRVGEQVMGRDAITTFGSGNKVSTRTEYDNNLDGVFETVVVDPAVTASLASYEIDPNAHQPYLDEFIVGFRRQFPMQTSLDVAWIKRSYKDMWANVDVNGLWPSAPYQPFGGFGNIDPNRGVLLQQTNNSWSTLEYQALEFTLAKNLSHGFQVLAGFNRQWHHMDGTWNPTDRAAYIQPDHFANDRNLYMPRGNNDRDSLPDTGNALSYGPTWMKYRGNLAATWMAPLGLTVAGSYTMQAGPWSGSPLYRLPANDPEIAQFGPASFRLPNGSTQSNPLATRNRYIFGDRGEGQFQAPTIHTVGLKVGKRFRLPGQRDIEIAGNIFNLLNAGDFTQFSYNSAYQTWSSLFLEMRNRQQARAFQLTLVGRF
jgi:hypothetical protein